MAIKSAGYNVIDAADGKEALSKMTGEKIHLLIIDINMPVMDGIAFIKAAKQLPHYKFTPFILLTTEVDAEKKQIVKEAGAKAWLNKPISNSSFIGSYRQICKSLMTESINQFLTHSF